MLAFIRGRVPDQYGMQLLHSLTNSKSNKLQVEISTEVADKLKMGVGFKPRT